jgi:uncharacterized protein (DUF983 family)
MPTAADDAAAGHVGTPPDASISNVERQRHTLVFDMASLRPSASAMLRRALARRCPNCGASGIFTSYTKLGTRCPNCGIRLQRGESDYFIGAYLLNLVAVELLFALMLGVWVVLTYPGTPWRLIQWVGLALMLAGAVLCYPFALSLWLAADLIFRPMSPEELDWHQRGGEDNEGLPHL